MFSEANVTLLKNIIEQDLLKAIGETLYMTFLPRSSPFSSGFPWACCWSPATTTGSIPSPVL